MLPSFYLRLALLTTLVEISNDAQTFDKCLVIKNRKALAAKREVGNIFI